MRSMTKRVLTAIIAGTLAISLGGCGTVSNVSGVGDTLSRVTGQSDEATYDDSNVQQHNVEDNDKKACYEVTSDDGKDTITSVIKVYRDDNSIVDFDRDVHPVLNDNSIDWYQVITGKNTGDVDEQAAYVYLPSGLTYDQVISVRDAFRNAGFSADAMTPSENSAFQTKETSLYHVELCYMGPASYNA